MIISFFRTYNQCEYSKGKYFLGKTNKDKKLENRGQKREHDQSHNAFTKKKSKKKKPGSLGPPVIEEILVERVCNI